MNTIFTNLSVKVTAVFAGLLMLAFGAQAQSNVFDNIIATSQEHTYLKAALEQANLDEALQDQSKTYTLFAPTNDAFNNLAQELNTDIQGVLALPNLQEVLLYHVSDKAVPSANIKNGDILNSLVNGKTLKISQSKSGMVNVNQAAVTEADMKAGNGVVHVIDAVLLPSVTVVDIAIDNGFTTLATAVSTAGLVPALSDPFAQFTVFAPSNAAFDTLAIQLNTTVPGLLQLPNLADILTYHVLGSSVSANMITNGDLVSPLSQTNTLKLTKTAAGSVYVNQAMVSAADIYADNGVVHAIDAVVLPNTTVVDVAISNGFTSLTSAVSEAGLLPALTDPFAEFTVFAPDNAAFSALATSLGTNIAGLLALPNLADILTYHVLGSVVDASMISNGDIVSPLSSSNTLKMTKKSTGEVYVNQAMVTLADVSADNGLVHVIDAVVLPSTTVVDVAIDNGFSTLASAVTTAGLIPALSDPTAQLTVFAPDNSAFTALAAELNTDVQGLLALNNLSDILLYHVLGAEVNAAAIANGDLITPLNGKNSLKMTKTSSSEVFINQAMVTMADVSADNGVVHVIDEVLLPVTTVADVAIKGGFTHLTSAVITAELLPTLSDPHAAYTVFAPTNDAFAALAKSMNTDINGLLGLSNLPEILLYHVVDGKVLSIQLTDGPVQTLNGLSVTIDLSNGVMINNANVLTADIPADNGVVHVIDEVLIPLTTGIEDSKNVDLGVFPNPTTNEINFGQFVEGEFQIYNVNGAVVIEGNTLDVEPIDVSSLTEGVYFIRLRNNQESGMSRFIKI